MPPDSDFTIVPHHEVGGREDGQPVVLSGSLGTTMAMWQPQLAPLGERFRVVRFDTRGHGGSAEPPGPYAIADLGRDALALLDALELERVAWIGVSLGGMVGIWLASNAPDRIERLVLCCSSAHMPPPQAWLERAAAVRAAGTVDVVADAVIGRWLTERWAAGHRREAAALRAMLASSPAGGYASCCEAIATMDQRSALASIRAPTLVIGGRHDAAAPPAAHAALLAERIAGARYELVDGAHLSSVECADTVNDLIIDHIGAPA